MPHSSAGSDPRPPLVTGDQGTLTVILEGRPTALEPGQPDLLATYRGPLMLLLLDVPTLARTDFATMLRRRAAMLSPEIALLVISPHALPEMHALPTKSHVVLMDTLGLASAMGIATLPGSALFNGDGRLLWKSGGELRLANRIRSADQYQFRTSGALTLGDVLC